MRGKIRSAVNWLKAAWLVKWASRDERTWQALLEVLELERPARGEEEL